MINRQEKIDFIRAKCIEANPSILDLELGIADSLLAIHGRDAILMDVDGSFVREMCTEHGSELHPLCTRYNFKTDDITLQSDETVDLVFNLLGGK